MVALMPWALGIVSRLLGREQMRITVVSKRTDAMKNSVAQSGILPYQRHLVFDLCVCVCVLESISLYLDTKFIKSRDKALNSSENAEKQITERMLKKAEVLAVTSTKVNPTICVKVKVLQRDKN